jgi:signal transduction histidine kinase/CheY-like chemotaxis protein
MSGVSDDEDTLLHSVALQNASSILAARQRAERDLIEAKDALEHKTHELAHSLSMMRATLESTSDGILVTDRSGRVTDFNEKYADMWQLPRDAMETRDHRWLLDIVALTVRDPEAFRARVDAIYASSPSDSLDVLDLVDGRAFERFTKIQFMDGQSIGRVWCYRDITERKNAEKHRQILLERAEAARQEADVANRAKDEFLAVISHELRTPLNAITGWANLLLNGDMSPEKRRHAVEVIGRNAKAQERLIEDLLDVSRIMAGKVRLNVDPIEPIEIVEMAIEAVRPMAHAKDVALQITLDPDAGTVMGDRDRLQQIVWNLLTNAIKFTAKHGTVQVRLRRQDSSVEVVVEDNGRGITPEFLPYVFERFRQADTSFTRSKGGIGLGLAIVRHLVELHGGAIKAESEGEGQGSTFTLALPIAPMRRRSAALPPRVPDGPVTIAFVSPPELEGLHFLVVDDEPDARDMLYAMLGHCGAVVAVASSAAEALDLVQQTRPDVLVSDVGMPGEDGYDLIRRVRALDSAAGGRTPAVALTAYARQSDRTQALIAGFDMHVPKPIDPSELAIVIANLHARHRHRD